MKHLFSVLRALAVCGLIVLSSGSLACAWEWKPKSLTQVEFLTGFSQSSLKKQGMYRAAPLLHAVFDFDAKVIFPKCERFPGLLQLQIEPYIDPIYAPDPNIAFGSYFMLKVGIVPESFKLQPYLRMGPGVTYMTLHTYEQGSVFNFSELGCAGAHYLISKNMALTVEYGFRHLSNAGLDDPNHGINTHFALVGVAYRF
jgi:hypothetical protein